MQGSSYETSFINAKQEEAKTILEKNYATLQSKSSYLNKFKAQQKTQNHGLVQQMSLINSQETIKKWDRAAKEIAEKQQRDPEETLLMRSNWDARRKYEVQNVLDLSETLAEKYSPSHAQELSLRLPPEPKPQLIHYKNKKGALIIDDRDKIIEVIREVPAIKTPRGSSKEQALKKKTQAHGPETNQ